MRWSQCPLRPGTRRPRIRARRQVVVFLQGAAQLWALSTEAYDAELKDTVDFLHVGYRGFGLLGH